MNNVKIEETTEFTIKEIYGVIERKVTTFGSGAKMDCSEEFLGRRVYLTIIKDDGCPTLLVCIKFIRLYGIKKGGIMTKYNIEGRYVYVKQYDLEVYYEIGGNLLNSSNTVVFIHAAASDSRLWHDMVRLLPSEYRYIMVDLPGHGKTFPINWKPIYEKKYYVQFMKNFIDVIDLQNFALCGDAIGARISLMFGATIDEKRLRGLILFEPSDYISGDWYGPLGSLEKDFPDALSISRWFLKLASSRIPHEAVSKISWLPLSNAYHVDLADLYQASLDVKKWLSNIDCFVALIRGIDDPLVSLKDLQEMKNSLKKAEITEINLAGHFAPLENPKASADAIIDILNKIF